MASKNIAKRPNGKYLARYRPPGSTKEITKTFDRKSDGQRWLDEQTAAIMTGRYVDPRKGKMTVREYVKVWVESQDHRASTIANVDTVFRLNFLPVFGDRQIGSIRPREIQTYVNSMRGKYVPGTVVGKFVPVRAMFNAAVADKILSESPCEGVKLPNVRKPKVVPMSTSEVFALEQAMPDRWRALVRLMAGTGLRPGEACGLTVDRVDFEKGELTVDRQLLISKGRPFGPPKTDSSYRTIPLPRTVADSLKAHIAEFGLGPEGLIFTSFTQGRINRHRLGIAVKREATKLKINPVPTMHSFRHYYASLLIHHGESVKVVQERLGHATSRETLDTYAHLFPDSEDTTRAAIDSVLGLFADNLRTDNVRTLHRRRSEGESA